MKFLLILLFVSSRAFAWGEVGHKIVAQYGAELVGGQALANCRVNIAQLTEHTNDPDRVWRNQRFRHPREAQMHYFHVDRQPSDWRTRDSAKDSSQGELVYRIVRWAGEAEKYRAKKDWDALAEHLYGLSHYVGDLSQPLHLTYAHDGDEVGLPDLHAQFETKMVNRYEEEVRAGVRARLSREKIPPLWKGMGFRDLVFDIAQQSNAKTARLFTGARPALKPTRRGSRFVKPLLWSGTGELAMDQLAIGARLWGFVLNSICQ